VFVPSCTQCPRSHCVLGVRLISTVGGLTQGRPPSPAIMVCNLSSSACHPFTDPSQHLSCCESSICPVVSHFFFSLL
jgi:hypothetical protein